MFANRTKSFASTFVANGRAIATLLISGPARNQIVGGFFYARNQDPKLATSPRGRPATMSKARASRSWLDLAAVERYRTSGGRP
jgi:hypothetical protein